MLKKELSAITAGENVMMYKTSEKEMSQKVFLNVEGGDQTKVQDEPFELGPCSKGLLDDYTYNLMEQLEFENRSLWRIKNDYKNNASMDNESRQLWRFIEKDKEKVVRLLTEKIRQRL